MQSIDLYAASTWIVPVILAITLHEAAHGWMAEKFGDDTARRLGRVTFNPFKHIDAMGTVILPALLYVAHSPVMFGYAKPVPVDFRNLRPLRKGMFMTAAAGPGSNILQAIIAGLLLALIRPLGADWFDLNLSHAIVINCVLAVFNMLPILPLDGGRVLRALLPGEIGRAYARSERFGMVIILILLFLPAANIVMQGVMTAAQFLMGLIFIITGNGS